jgi:ElaB/YqjD/DUF883 family membrane-anchored ribosome-binding protein
MTHAAIETSLLMGDRLAGVALRRRHDFKGAHVDTANEKLTEELEETLRAARGQLEGLGRELGEQVRKHPLAALSIVAVVGVAVGVLLARK